MTSSKTCTKCKTDLPIDQFARHAGRADGYQNQCRPCVRAYNRAYYLTNSDDVKHAVSARYRNNPDKVKAYVKAWQATNPDLFRTYVSKWQDNNVEARRSIAQRRRARLKNNGIFTVSKREIVALYSSPCFYCGSTSQITADHVVPIARGGSHSVGNLVPACDSCNKSKNDRTIMEWKLSKKVVA